MSLKSFFLIVLFLIVSPAAWATDYWISKTGNDSNNCKTETTGECASIQKAISAAVAGDRIYIKAGTYVEDSSKSTFTVRCSWFERTSSLCINSSGKKDSPILISAAPNAVEGSVIIDSVNARIGVTLLANDYITFRGLTFKNSIKNAIANQGQAGNAVADPALLSVGVIIENCKFYTVTTPDAGDNIAAIGMWSTQDWIVRNNYIEDVRTGSGVRSYGVLNALIEHNTMKDVNEGIMWKDHFVKDLASRQHMFESEIRYNLISAIKYGVLIQIRGSDTPEAGHNYIHHNIFYGLSGSEPAGLRLAMAGAYAQSGDIKFNHNLVDCSNGTSTVGLTVDASTSAEFSGNVFVKCGTPIEAIKYSDTKVAHITASNNNVFIGSFSAVMDRYSPTSIAYTTLDAWKKAKNASSISLEIDSPDANSKQVAYATTLFLSTATRLFAPQAGSPVLGLLPDGTNAGPYQIGTEVIGIIDQSTLKSPPLPPTVNKL